MNRVKTNEITRDKAIAMNNNDRRRSSDPSPTTSVLARLQRQEPTGDDAREEKVDAAKYFGVLIEVVIPGVCREGGADPGSMAY